MQHKFNYLIIYKKSEMDIFVWNMKYVNECVIKCYIEKYWQYCLE